MANIEEVEAKRAELRAASLAAKNTQKLVDLEAILALEVEHGEDIATLEANRFVPGQPVVVGVKAPSADYYKRYQQKVRRAGVAKNSDALGAAGDELAKSCWVYPSEPEAQKAMLDAFPGLLASIFLRVTSLAEMRADDEKNG